MESGKSPKNPQTEEEEITLYSLLNVKPDASKEEIVRKI